MSRKLPPASGGVAGMALLYCLAAGAAGLAFDLLRDAPNAFWFLADPGGRAALGAGAVVCIVLIAHAARLLLARRPQRSEEGRDGRDHP
jgi:hypothetical protein